MGHVRAPSIQRRINIKSIAAAAVGCPCARHKLSDAASPLRAAYARVATALLFELRQSYRAVDAVLVGVLVDLRLYARIGTITEPAAFRAQRQEPMQPAGWTEQSRIDSHRLAWGASEDLVLIRPAWTCNPSLLRAQLAAGWSNRHGSWREPSRMPTPSRRRRRGKPPAPMMMTGRRDRSWRDRGWRDRSWRRSRNAIIGLPPENGVVFGAILRGAVNAREQTAVVLGVAINRHGSIPLAQPSRIEFAPLRSHQRLSHLRESLV